MSRPFPLTSHRAIPARGLRRVSRARFLRFAAALATGGFAARAADLDDFFNEAGKWVEENVDSDALSAVAGIGHPEIKQFLEQMRKAMEGLDPRDLAELREAARHAVNVMDQYEETEDFAAWLRTRLDYFEVAEQFRQMSPPPPKTPKEGPPPKPSLPPSAEVQRKKWVAVVEERPVPDRARDYLPKLKAIFVAERVPPALVWLAEVESSFNPEARSPAGAAGLYQLMPATAQNMGLALQPKDERLIPEKNARAASQYLRRLHYRFRDWRLTLAAYNAGEGRIQALLKRHRAKTFDAIVPHVPAETQLYVPKVEAVLARREGVTLASLKGP